MTPAKLGVRVCVQNLEQAALLRMLRSAAACLPAQPIWKSSGKEKSVCDDPFQFHLPLGAPLTLGSRLAEHPLPRSGEVVETKFGEARKLLSRVVQRISFDEKLNIRIFGPRIRNFGNSRAQWRGMLQSDDTTFC